MNLSEGFVHLPALGCPKEMHFVAVRSHVLGAHWVSHLWHIFSKPQGESAAGLVWLHWLREQPSRIYLLCGMWPPEGQETWRSQLVRPVGSQRMSYLYFPVESSLFPRLLKYLVSHVSEEVFPVHIFQKPGNFQFAFLFWESTGDTTKRMNILVYFWKYLSTHVFFSWRKTLFFLTL